MSRVFISLAPNPAAPDQSSSGTFVQSDESIGTGSQSGDKHTCRIKTKEPTVACYHVIHCKNKLVVLTTEWLPWLQTNWRDSGC